MSVKADFNVSLLQIRITQVGNLIWTIVQIALIDKRGPTPKMGTTFW